MDLEEEFALNYPEVLNDVTGQCQRHFNTLGMEEVSINPHSQHREFTQKF